MHQHQLIIILKERRDELKITQGQLAEMANVGLRTLKAIEGGNANPTLETMNKLLDVLGLELMIDIKNLKNRSKSINKRTKDKVSF